jgi:hypothetical protein
MLQSVILFVLWCFSMRFFLRVARLTERAFTVRLLLTGHNATQEQIAVPISTAREWPVMQHDLIQPVSDADLSAPAFVCLS